MEQERYIVPERNGPRLWSQNIAEPNQATGPKILLENPDAVRQRKLGEKPVHQLTPGKKGPIQNGEKSVKRRGFWQPRHACRLEASSENENRRKRRHVHRSE